MKSNGVRVVRLVDMDIEVAAIVREYVFTFLNPKTRLFTFFEVSCQKNVKKRRKLMSKFSLSSTLKLLTDTFAVKQLHVRTCHVIHTTLH